MSALSALNETLWYPWLLVLFLLTGAVSSAKTGFFQLFGLRVWLRATVGSILRPARGNRADRGITQVHALCAALASTIGTGSIAGVAAAICIGGPGAVFWMWISALLGMMTSFAEKTLAVRYRRPSPEGGWLGGPMYYMCDGLRCPKLGSFYAVICLGTTLISGNLVQSGAIAGALHAVYGWNRLAVGLAVSAAAGTVMLGGIRRLGTISSVLVPCMTALYLVSGGLIILRRCSELPALFKLILTCAFSPVSFSGGAAGYTVSQAIRCGIARGIFTNEAGLGTSSIAHAAANSLHPAQQGMWGILECGISTLLVCTVTAFVFLLSGFWPHCGTLLPPSAGMAAAFSASLGPSGGQIVAVCLLLFAFSSILGWSYYGQQCIRYLSSRRSAENIYMCFFLFCIAAGSLWDGTSIWVLVDLCSAFLAVPNLLTLLALSGQACGELQDFMSRASPRKTF